MKSELKNQQEKYETCRYTDHASEGNGIAVFVKPGCPRASLIKGHLVSSKDRCKECRSWKGKGGTDVRILKQTLDIADEATYNLPGKNVTFLSVQEQRGTLVLYFMSDATADELADGSPIVPVRILIAGTGHKRGDIADAQYIGTVMMSYGLVWHCFAE